MIELEEVFFVFPGFEYLFLEHFDLVCLQCHLLVRVPLFLDEFLLQFGDLLLQMDYEVPLRTSLGLLFLERKVGQFLHQSVLHLVQGFAGEVKFHNKRRLLSSRAVSPKEQCLRVTLYRSPFFSSLFLPIFPSSNYEERFRGHLVSVLESFLSICLEFGTLEIFLFLFLS